MSSDTPDVLEPAHWIENLEDPVQQFVQASIMGDLARDVLLPRFAELRRHSALKAREKLMAPHLPCQAAQEGMQFKRDCTRGHLATEAAQALAQVSGMSAQTVGRMVAEARSYLKREDKEDTGG